MTIFGLAFFFPLQTFVNDVRIQEQMYITLKLEDKLRFGYDILSLLTPSTLIISKTC